MIRQEVATIGGSSIRFTRRRYGSTTYTWVEALIDGQWVELGDPWPCVTPKRSEIGAAIEAARKKSSV